MATDWAARLQLVQAAIDGILTGGQDVQFDGKRVVEADLDKLHKLEYEYERRANRQAQGGRGMRVRYGVVP